jgi:hypothetical protein
VTLADLHETGFPRVITKPKLAELLEEKYPGHPWEKLYLLKGRFAQQRRLEKAVTSLFPVRTYLFYLLTFFILFAYFLLYIYLNRYFNLLTNHNNRVKR